MLTILGPTACGKTTLAVEMARYLGAEIISADSRQFFRGMDIGTGKDLKEYTIDGISIPHHLIDIANPGDEYTLFHFQRDFLVAYQDIVERGKKVVFCGGSGLYLESVLRAYNLSPVPANLELRDHLKNHSLAQLTEILAGFKELHNNTDTDTVQRAIRAIEIETHYKEHPQELCKFPKIDSTVIGIDVPRDIRRKRITKRLSNRLKEGMVEEVKQLLDSGVAPQVLINYGLEYRFLTLFLTKQMTYEDMVSKLEIAIHQFAKRQMTWFRGMERRGIKIHWVNGMLSLDEMRNEILNILSKENPL